jgi:hypothetical protein
MAKYTSTITIDAFIVTDQTPDFHGSKLVLLDDGSVKLATTDAPGTQNGDYFVQPALAPSYFLDKAAFEAEGFVPLAS